MGLKEEIENLKASIALKEELLKRQVSQGEADARSALASLQMTYVWTVKRGQYGFSDERREGISLVGEADDASCARVEAYAAKYPDYWAKLKPHDSYSGGEAKPKLTLHSVAYFGEVVAPNVVIVTADGSGWCPIKMRKGRYAVLTQEQWDALSTLGTIPS